MKVLKKLRLTLKDLITLPPHKAAVFSEIPGQPKNVIDNVSKSDFDRLTSKKLTK